jgi:hypothetical protein
MDLQYEGRVIPIHFYAMPRVGKPLTIQVNGETCEAKTTKWQEFRNTYWLYKNVAMYVREHLPEGAECRIQDLPDGFGAAEKPAHRKSYYKPKPKEQQPA